jgi:hypothetical protein
MAYYNVTDTEYWGGSGAGSSSTLTTDYTLINSGTTGIVQDTGNLIVGNYGYIDNGTTSNYTIPIYANGALSNHTYDNRITNMVPLTYTPWANYECTGSAGRITADGLIVNGTINFDSNWANNYVVWPIAPTKNGLFQEKLRSNLAIIVKSRAELPGALSPAERTAMETLREVISEAEFRKYMRYGFVLVKGKSGDTFQVFRNRSHTKIWRNGQVVEEVCVRIQDSKVPPTDNVIAFRSIIQSDEEAFRKLGNVYKMKKAA